MVFASFAPLREALLEQARLHRGSREQSAISKHGLRELRAFA